MFDELTIILPCHFGLEKVTKNELIKLGYDIESVTDGEVKIKSKFVDIPKLNINLRTVERVMIEIKNFKATTFEELYQNILSIPLEEILPVDANFLITKANHDKNSILHSPTAIQSIVKKAMVDRLKNHYHVDNLTEEGKTFPFRVKFNKNICSLRLDTSGNSLHKRGYRIKTSDAPISETLASAIIMLTPFKKDRVLLDPFCGSGTFPIESALISANIAPGLNRAFISETWKDLIDKKIWIDEVENAKSRIDKDVLNDKSIKIFGSDIDNKMISISIDNAKRANVLNMIEFKNLSCKDVTNSYKNGFLITNPPYGERLENNDSLVPIYKELKYLYDKLDNWSMSVITSFNEANKYLGKEDKNRKLYNGMIKTYLYQYFNKGFD